MSAVAFRHTVRLRLTLLFGVVFIGAGTALLVLTYLLVQHSLQGPEAVTITSFPSTSTAPTLGRSPSGSTSGLKVEVADPDLVKLLRVNVQRAQRGTMRTLVGQSAIALGIMTLVSVWLGWVVAGRALGPVHRITVMARRLSQETLHERIALKGPDDELKELADTFDRMLDRLDAVFDSQRRFVANASHELRNPLAVQRTLVDVCLADQGASNQQLREAMAKIRDVTDESERLIGSLMALARSDRGLETLDKVNLAEVASDAIDRMRTDVERRGIRIEATLDPADVMGDSALLERMVGNLLENAARHNHHEGWIGVFTGASEGRSFVRVSNSGEPVPDEAIPMLLEPFRRLDRDRTSANGGAGLGLSIVQSVATAHGGHISVSALATGGLEVVVTLPAVPAARPLA